MLLFAIFAKQIAPLSLNYFDQNVDVQEKYKRLLFSVTVKMTL